MDFPFRAVVFDLDGLIVETEQPIYDSYQTILAEFGLPLPIAVWEDVIGRGGVGSRDPLCDYLEASLGKPVDRDALRERARAMHRERSQTLPTREGVREHIQEAREAGLRLGVASSSSRRWVGGHLERLGILPVFSSVKTSDDVANVKPDPELYLSVTRALGARPDETLAIEDSAHGVTAAKAAGLYCVAVPNPITRHLTLDHADWRVESLEELSLSDLIARSRG